MVVALRDIPDLAGKKVKAGKEVKNWGAVRLRIQRVLLRQRWVKEVPDVAS